MPFVKRAFLRSVPQSLVVQVVGIAGQTAVIISAVGTAGKTAVAANKAV